MKRSLLISLVAIGLLAPLSALAQRTDSESNFGSLYPQRNASPFLDRIARRPGDLLTILISETSTAQFTASTQATKQDANTVNKMTVPILDKIPLVKDILGGLSTGNSSSNSGTGSTQQSNRLAARMTVVVKEVFPNGTMFVEGERWIKVNNETQTFVLSGLVRSDDIRTDNTVLSESLANAEIRAEGKGLIAERQRRGLITRILDWLF